MTGVEGVALSLLVWTPLLGALSLLAVPGGEGTRGEFVRKVSLFWTLVALALSIWVFRLWDSSRGELQLLEQMIWIEPLGVRYALGVDGISIYLLLLTTGLMPLVVLTSTSITKSLRGYLASMLVLETAMLGTLVAQDLFLFYVFWELMLAPMYFIIGIWGGSRRVYATVKFVLYTVVGSLLMLAAILYVVWKAYGVSGEVSFALDHLLQHTRLSLTEELWLFAAFALAFGIKVPIFPFHTWLPDAHVEAPTGGSVVLAGVLLKMGLYGFIRFAYPLFPRAAEIATPLLCGLAVIGVVYGALVAWAQEDMKKLVAYSSVSHLGYCVLGFFAFNMLSVSGSIIQMINHGISTGALFLLVGVLYDRTHSRKIADYSGLAGTVPLYAFLFMVFTFSSIAVPLTNGFVGEFMILSGSFRGEGPVRILTGVAILGVVLSAVYMLTLTLKIMFGEYANRSGHDIPDVTRREFIPFVPLLFFVFYLGLYPQPIIDGLTPSLERYFQTVQARLKNVPLPIRVVPNPAGGEHTLPGVVAESGQNFGNPTWLRQDWITLGQVAGFRESIFRESNLAGFRESNLAGFRESNLATPRLDNPGPRLDNPGYDLAEIPGYSVGDPASQGEAGENGTTG